MQSAVRPAAAAASQPSLARKVALSSGLNIIQQGIAIVSSIIVARVVGPEVLGILAYAGAYIGMFGSLGDLGFGTAHIKRVSEGRDIAQCMGMIWLVKGVLLLAMVAGVMVAYWSGGRASFSAPGERAVFYLVLLTLAAGQMQMVPVTTLTAFQDIARKDTPPIFATGANALLRLAVVGLGFGVVGLATADLTTTLLLLVVYMWMLRTLPMAWPAMDTFKHYARYAAPMFGIGLVTSLGERLDRVLLNTYAGTVAVGQYSAGMRLGAMLQFLSLAVAGVVFPSMSRAYSEGRPEEAFALCNRAERRLALVLFPLALAIAAISRPLALFVLGPKYADTGPVIALATIAMVLQAIAQPYRQIIGGAEKMALNLAVNVVLFAVEVGLLYVFLAGPQAAVPAVSGGAPGAALALALSALLGALLWRVAAVCALGARLDRRLSVHIGSALTLFAATYYLGSTAFGQTPLAALLIGCAAVGLHLLVLRLAGELGRSEIEFVLSLVPTERLAALSLMLRGGSR